VTIGIYCLEFEGTDKVYIGQSVNIERRFKQHINYFKIEEANKKLMEAFKLYGYPRLKILVECNIEELNNLEVEAIQIYDSINRGFNILNQATYKSTNIGEDSSNSIYSNNQIIDVLNHLSDNEIITYKEISLLTGMSETNIRKIVSGDTYLWLKDKYPIKYQKMLNNIKSRATISRSKGHSAKGRGIVYPSILSPEGVIYSNIDNASKFAEKHSLSNVQLCKLFNQKILSHKGWKLCQQEQAY